jgi:hypothetical protein
MQVLTVGFFSIALRILFFPLGHGQFHAKHPMMAAGDYGSAKTLIQFSPASFFLY